MIFQSDIQHIDTELSQLQALLDAKRQQRSLFKELDAETNAAIEMVALLKTKIEAVNSNAIASLKSAVLQLFTGDSNNGGDGGNQPTEPTPSPDSDEGQVTDDEELTGQTCTITPIDNENKGTEAVEIIPQLSSTEMIHTSARTGYLKLRESGQILAAYAWFSRKDLAESWHDFLDGMSLGSPELRLSQRNSSWKYEIKFTGLSMTQVERLASEDLSRKPSKKKESPAQAAGLEPPSGWRQAQPKEDSPQLFAKVLLPESEYVGQVLPVSRVSANEIGYTLTLPNGENRWYRADMVQVVDAEIDKNASPTEPAQPEDEAVLMAQNPQEAEAYEFNDIVQVTSDGNDCVGLVGSFGRVKVIKGDRIGVEIDEQLVYFKRSELKLKVKAETPSLQQNHPPSADVSISDQEAIYLQTNGNYKGLSKQICQRWEQAGINPSDLIADMKAKRPAEPAWDAERYNPVLAGVGADDPLDF